jgi:asparagine synthase (glutamine-hydrolysing)
LHGGTDARVAVCRGSARFLDEDVAAIARSRGDPFAWIELVARLGGRAPTRVQGRFAAAVLDIETGNAFLAVDRFSIETWCYAMADSGLAFSNRADAVPGARREIDPQAIFDYLYFHVIPSPRTAFQGIARLLPGHVLTFADGRCDIERYWRPRFDESSSASTEELRTQFRTLVTQAVARTAEKGEVGAYLSGGTDSSTVAGTLGRITGKPARTYSIGFDAAGYDEMEYARIAAAHFGTSHHEYYVTPRDIADNVSALAAHFDQPFGNSSVLPAFCCARLAREDGLAKVLAGDGGDELFGGNERYAKQRVFDAYGALPAGFRNRVLEPVILGRPLLARLPLARKLVSYVEQARVPMPDRMEMYNLLLRMGTNEMLAPDFLAAVDQESPLSLQREIYAASDARSLINRMLAYDWKLTLTDSDLPKVVGSADVAGVQVGFPLLDDDLVDFSLRLAPALKLRGLRLRYFFKDALRDFLPDAILRKTKHGFGLPFGPWVLEGGPLREFVLDSLHAAALRRYVRPSFITELVETHLPAHPGYYGEMLWILMMLEQWLNRTGGPRDSPDESQLCSPCGAA